MHVSPQSRPLGIAMAFVDAGYLTIGAKKYLKLGDAPRIDGDTMASWPRWAYPHAEVLRTYVYDAQYTPDDDRYAEQRAYFDTLAAQPGIRLRLGHLIERSAGTAGARVQQKGVDTLLVLDLVRLAQLRAFGTALIIAGDRDLAEALRVIADDYARRVILFSIKGSSPAKELVQAADDHGVITDAHLRMLVGRPLKRGQKAALALPVDDHR